MTDDIANVIATSSLLLAVIAALMSVWYADVAKAIDEKEPTLPAEKKALGKRIAPVFWTKALPLAIGATSIAIVFLPRALGIVAEAVAAWGKGGTYDDMRTACVVTQGLMILLAGVTLQLAWRLGAKRQRMR